MVFLAGKNGKSTPSVSAESIENRSPEQRRRSKSILKRHHQQQNQQPKTSSAAVASSSSSSQTPQGSPTAANPVNHRIGIRRTTHVDPETEKLIPDNASDCSPGRSPRPSSPQHRQLHQSHDEVALLQDLLHESAGRPIYICPPPPPMSGHGDGDRRPSYS